MSPTKVTIDGIRFDRARYDRDADVLYLAAGDPARARDFDGTPGREPGGACRFALPAVVPQSAMNRRKP